MKTGILMTLPRSDDITEYLSVFSEEIVEYSLKKLIIKMSSLLLKNKTFA